MKKNYVNIHQQYLMNTYPFRGKTFIRGEGVYLYDQDGEKYLDLMTNYGVSIFGYNNSTITAALQEQLVTLPSLHCSFANDVRAAAAQALVKRTGGKLQEVYFANSGTEAVEAALKFAVLSSGKTEIIAAKGSYHGKTMAALSATHSEKYKKGLEKMLWNVKFVPYDDVAALEATVSNNTAAVILEPVQGESGIVPPSAGYLPAVQELCKAQGVLLIFDEIQTGAGRTGAFLAAHQEGVESDIVCLGKGLAGGIPVGATLVSKKVSDQVPKLSQTSTFGGNPLACRGILEVLQLLDEAQLQKNVQLGKYFLQKLQALASKRIIEVRGRGLMIGLEVSGDRNQILKALQHQHILACPAGEQVVRFLPPYIVTKQHIDKAVSALESIL